MPALVGTRRSVLSGSSSGFNPEKLSVPLLSWHRSDKGITQDTNTTVTVTNWANLAATGSKYDWSQSTKANQPLYVSNGISGYPVLRFDGSNDNLIFAAAGRDIAQNRMGLSVVMVMQTSAPGSSKFVFYASNNAGASRAVVNREQTAALRVGIAAKHLDADSTAIVDAASYIASEWGVDIALFDYANAQASYYHNTTAIFTNSTMGTAGATSNTASTIVSLFGNAAANNAAGDLAEMFVFNGVLSAADITKLQDYVALRYNKFGQTLSFSTPTKYTTFQRNGSNQADIAITGLYSGFPSAIEARFNGGAWQTIATAPSGGTFSGTLTAQAMGQGGLELRYKNNQYVTKRIEYVGIGDIFICAGQSNMSGRGINLNQTYTSNTGVKATLFGNDGAWKEIYDPYDDWVNQFDASSADTNIAAGSFVPFLATHFLQNNNIPIAFVPVAKGSTSITQWQPGADHLDRTTLYGSMNYRIGKVGGAKCVLWWQGEQDAASMSQATYDSLFETMVNALAADKSVKVMPCLLQNSVALPDAGEANIRAAVVQAWTNNVNVLVGPDFSDIGSDNFDGENVHIQTDAKLQTVADRWWAKLQAAFGYS